MKINYRIHFFFFFFSQNHLPPKQEQSSLENFNFHSRVNFILQLAIYTLSPEILDHPRLKFEFGYDNRAPRSLKNWARPRAPLYLNFGKATYHPHQEREDSRA